MMKTTGTTICGLIYKDGVILAADTRACMKEQTGATTLIDQNCSKINRLSNNIYCCGAGSAADMKKLSALVETYLDSNIIQTNQMPVICPVTLIKRTLYKQRSFLMCTFIVGGIDKQNGKQLYNMYLQGSLNHQTFCAMGSGLQPALGILEGNYKENMYEEEALNLIIDAVTAGIKHDLGSGGKIDITIIKTNGEVINYKPYKIVQDRIKRIVPIKILIGTTEILKTKIIPVNMKCNYGIINKNTFPDNDHCDVRGNKCMEIENNFINNEYNSNKINTTSDTKTNKNEAHCSMSNNENISEHMKNEIIRMNISINDNVHTNHGTHNIINNKIYPNVNKTMPSESNNLRSNIFNENHTCDYHHSNKKTIRNVFSNQPSKKSSVQYENNINYQPQCSKHIEENISFKPISPKSYQTNENTINDNIHYNEETIKTMSFQSSSSETSNKDLTNCSKQIHTISNYSKSTQEIKKDSKVHIHCNKQSLKNKLIYINPSNENIKRRRKNDEEKNFKENSDEE